MTAGRFGGVLPAVVTPVGEAGQFERTPFERLLGRLYAAGVDGIYVCGSTGEGMQLSVEQRRAVAEAAVELSPSGAQVIVHVGASAAEDALTLARHAVRAGASAVSSLPPPGKFGFRELREYYARLAGETGLPLFLYYYPEVGGSVLTLDELLELCALPRVAGIKITDFDLYRLRMLKEAGAVVFSGRDEVMVAGLLMGADGAIGTFYNLLPGEAVRIHRLARAGRWEEARDTQDRINSLVRVVAPFPLFPAVKQLLEWSGIDCGGCLPPRLRLEPAEREELRRRARDAGFPALIAAAPGFPA